MKQSLNPRSEGSVKVDPTKIDTRDLVEAWYALISACTLLRQSFGIVAMTNELISEKLSESELKSFANQFDIVHKTINTFAAGLKQYIDGRSVKVRTPNSASKFL